MGQCNFQVRIKFLPLINPATAQEKNNLETKYIYIYVCVCVCVCVCVYTSPLVVYKTEQK